MQIPLQELIKQLGNICHKDDIYVDKEEEYDHLHTSRPKKLTIQTEDDRYGSASYLEDDSYSTLRQNRMSSPILITDTV